LYLAEHTIDGQVHYLIRESYMDGGTFKSRDLFDLGPYPARYIIYPGGNAFYIEDTVCDALYELGVDPGTDELEEVFWPFLEPRVRRLVDSARQRAKGRQKRTPIGPEQERQIKEQASTFDKRRSLYLRSGEVNQGRIGNIPIHLYKWVLGKSRDEIEHAFIRMERCLEPSERKVYTFVIFDLQRFFTESWAKKIPQGLNEAKMDKHFLKEICCLSSDKAFRGEIEDCTSLNEHLIRYAVMFFDYDFGPDTFWQDYVKQFMDARRKHRPPPNRSSVSLDEASVIFGVKKDALSTMTQRGLERLYRRVAQKVHPDKGGTHEQFIRLTETYHELMARKGKPPRWTRKW